MGALTGALLIGELWRTADVVARRAAPGWTLALLLMIPTAAATQVAAPPSDADFAATLHAERRDAQRAHLKRVGVWGLANTAAGLGMLGSAERDEHPTLYGFGVQTVGWGVVNAAIAALGLTLGGEGDDEPTMAEALREEAGWGRLLVLNQGLNVGYMMVGGALWIASSRGLERGDEVRGHAQAVVLQGAGLFVLDGIAWLAHRRRMRSVEGWAERVQVAVDPRGGIRVGWALGPSPSGRGAEP